MYVRQSTTIQVIGLLLATSLLVDVYALVTHLELKLFWAYASVAITLAGYAIYISQMYPDEEGKTIKPQPLSWIGFGFLTGAGWLVQISQGGEAGSWCLGITALACFVIGIWSFARFSWRFDLLSVCISCTGIALFIVSDLTRRTNGWATFSAISATLADLAFYEPTFKKAWRLPREESVTNFIFNSIKCIPALLALRSYSIATTVYLVMLMIVNGGFATFLLWRRRHLRLQEVPLVD